MLSEYTEEAVDCRGELVDDSEGEGLEGTALCEVRGKLPVDTVARDDCDS